MNIETVIELPTIPQHKNRGSTAVAILSWRQQGHALRVIHAYLPGATWAKIADTIYDAYWRKLMVGAIQI